MKPTFVTMFACAAVLSTVAAARAQEVSVPGTANPNLAGRAGGYTCCAGDGSPGQDPVSIAVSSCERLYIAAAGKVSYEPGNPGGNNPDGDEAFSMTNYGDGISAPANVRANALVGVFLTDASPTGKPTPLQLDFESNLGFGSLEPGIGQIFFIGDGRTADTAAGQYNGQLQVFTAPEGATQLYLGTADGSGWYNNSGSFSVEVTDYPDQQQSKCGDLTGDGIKTGDALLVLRAAVGTALCPNCVCDADGSGGIAAGDALAVLRRAVGLNAKLACGCCPIQF